MPEQNSFLQMTFSNDKCFLCGVELTNENKTKEHIIPKWLQGSFNLWNQTMTLLNSTTIKYKDLVIPCCRECNGLLSTKIEKPLQELVDGGYDVFVNGDRIIVFQWLNKISYGILFKEMSLRIDRRDPSAGQIYPSHEMMKRKMQYLFLKSIIFDTNFHNNPYSIFVFKVKNNEKSFWFWENPFLNTFCMRMNDIGIVACLMDNGINESFFKKDEKYTYCMKQTLHPVQFIELCARIVYKESLNRRTPEYLVLFNKDGVMENTISYRTAGEIYDEWDQEKYADVFDCLLNNNHYSLPCGKAYQGNGLVYTTLFDENGCFIDIPLSE